MVTTLSPFSTVYSFFSFVGFVMFHCLDYSYSLPRSAFFPFFSSSDFSSTGRKLSTSPSWRWWWEIKKKKKKMFPSFLFFLFFPYITCVLGRAQLPWWCPVPLTYIISYRHALRRSTTTWCVCVTVWYCKTMVFYTMYPKSQLMMCAVVLIGPLQRRRGKKKVQAGLCHRFGTLFISTCPHWTAILFPFFL